MVRILSILAVSFACFVMVSAVRADDQAPPQHKHKTAEQRFDALETAAHHSPLTGVLTKAEFVSAFATVAPKAADKAEKMYTDIKKADEGKVTKAEFVAWAKSHHGHKKAA